MIAFTCISAKRSPMQRCGPPPKGTHECVWRSSSARAGVKRSGSQRKGSGHHSSMAGSPADVPTQECITKAETRAVASIDKVCVDVPGNPPCYTPGMSGADWVALGEIAVDAVTPSLYCGS